MAFDINSFVSQKTSKNTTGFSVDRFLASKGFQKQDLSTSGGLYRTAQQQGGEIALAAENIMNPEKSFWAKVRGGSKRLLGTTLDLLMRPNYAIATAVKNELDDDTETNFLSGLKSGILGRTKNTFSDVFEEAGWNPETRAGKIAKGVSGFALDVLLDPTTYVTFGTGAGIKVGGKVLSKAGVKFAAKAASKKLGTEFGEDFIRRAVVNMAENSPELYGKFLDQGGIKFFGNTLISGGRIAGAVQKIPMMSKLDDLTAPARNSLYALFHRDASAKFGKLPQEFIELKQKFLDLGAHKSAHAVDEAIQIARANKITQKEAEIITNAIENALPLADERLNNAKKLFETVLGRNLREELKRGIKVGELPNYVPHILLDNKVKAIPFKPEGARVALGAAKGRKIQKFVSETGEEIIGTADALGLKAIDDVQGLVHDISFGEFRSIKDIENTLGKFGIKLKFKPQARLRGKYAGYFKPSSKEIVIASARPTLDDVLSTVKHEIVHGSHFQLAGDIQMLETFTGKGVSKNLAKMLDNAKTSAKEEFEAILNMVGIKDVKKMSRAEKAYYKKPTELLAHGMQQYLKNPDEALAKFPKTVAAFKELQEKHPLFKLTKRQLLPSGEIVGDRVFQDATGKLFSTKATEQATVREINEAFGKEFFDPNIINAVAMRSTASARATTASDFLREAAQKFGAAVGNAPSNYVKTGVKELDGFVFHPAIAEQIDTFRKALINDEATTDLLRAFDKVQNLWKASVTSIFPAFHGRNAISNVLLNFLDIGADSLNPAKHLMAGQLLDMNRQAKKLELASKAVGKKAIKAKEELATLLKKPVLVADGKKWTFGKLRKAIQENRVAFGSDYTGFLDIRETVAEKLGEAATIGQKGKKVAKAVNPFSQENILFKTGRKTGQVIEEQARLVNFLTNLQRTGDVTTAAARTKQFLFDYTNLSNFEKTFMRRVIPFYTFMRKNLELQAKQLVRQPGKFATQAKGFKAISESFADGALTDDEKKKLPEWLQAGLGLVMKRDGSKISIINQLGTPLEAVFANLQPNAILGSLSPVVAVPLQVAIGKHFFFERDLKDVDDARAFQNAPQFIKDYIGYTTRKNKDGSIRHIALNPTRLFIVQNIPPSSRVVSVIGQLEEENVSGKLKLLRQLTGLKPYGKDLDTEELYREKEKVRALQDLLDKTGVAPIFKRSFIPKEKFQIGE